MHGKKQKELSIAPNGISNSRHDRCKTVTSNRTLRSIYISLIRLKGRRRKVYFYESKVFAQNLVRKGAGMQYSVEYKNKVGRIVAIQSGQCGGTIIWSESVAMATTACQKTTQTPIDVSAIK